MKIANMLTLQGSVSAKIPIFFYFGCKWQI